MSRLPRKELWYVRRAEIMEKAGRPSLALEAYGQALKSIEQLPPARRNVRAIKGLQSSIQSAMAKLVPNKAEAPQP